MAKIYRKYPIPGRLNVMIIGTCSIFYTLLLWAGSHALTGWFLLPVCILFALNLNPVYSLIHEAHHQNPKIPWLHLKKFVEKDAERVSYWKNYIRLWKGPGLNDEPPPLLLKKHSYYD